MHSIEDPIWSKQLKTHYMVIYIGGKALNRTEHWFPDKQMRQTNKQTNKKENKQKNKQTNYKQTKDQ